MLTDNRGWGLPGPETRQLRAPLDLRHCPAGFSLNFLDRHGNFQRVLATFH
jgi:hypothetical protein